MSILTNSKRDSRSDVSDDDIRGLNSEKEYVVTASEAQIDQKAISADTAVDSGKNVAIKIDSSVATDMVARSTTAATVTDAEILAIEHILEEGKELGDAYAKLSPEKQVEFRKQEEDVALIIKNILLNVHVNIKKVFMLILGWLKILPGINRFFLEQEAKIKTDKVLKIKK